MMSSSMPTAKFPANQTEFRRKLQPTRLPSTGSSRRIVCGASTGNLKPQIDDGFNSNRPSNRMFILGMGYVGQFFAQQLKNQGWDVSGTCTSITKKRELQQKGFDVHVFDACQPEWKILDTLSCYTHLLISIPPLDGIGDPMLQHEKHLKSRLVGGNLQWLSYLSSTSLYGDSEGAWVDEDYPPMPTSKVGKRRLEAEERWLNLGQDLGLSSYVFRLGGIYGPERSAIDTILKNVALSESQKRRATRTFTSRVHVADICQALKASMSMQFQRKIYNVVDDDPASRAQVFEFALELIQKKWPSLIHPTAAFSIHSTEPKGGQKRVSNARLKKELGVSLLHPTYTSGLQTIIDHIDSPFS